METPYTKRLSKLYAMLVSLDAQGKPCPSNADLAQTLGCSISAASGAMVALRDAGKIIVTPNRAKLPRVVVIAGTSEPAAPANPKPRLNVDSAPADVFSERMRSCSGWFDDISLKPMRHTRMVPPSVTRSNCGISEVYSL